MNRRLKKLGAKYVAPAVILALGSSLRIRFIGRENMDKARVQGPGQVIYTFWHECMLGLSYTHRRQGICILISRHSDGEYIARATSSLGFSSARGSSSSAGAAGVSGMIRAAENGRDLAVTPDGPRGPRHVVKPGVVHLASRTGLAIMPLSVDASKGIRLKSWDRFLIPLPLSRFVVGFGDPLFVPREVTKESINELCEMLRTRLIELGELVTLESRR
jgi:hypothetical protein